MKKRVWSIVLTLVMVASAFAVLPKRAYADRSLTKQEAVTWLRNQSEAYYDLDGAYGAQCSDFTSAYMNWLVTGNARSGTYGVYNANYYPTVAGWNTSRWEVIENYSSLVPEPGDIFITNGSMPEYGHTGVVISSTVNKATIIDQNARSSTQNAYLHEITWGAGGYVPYYFIRYKGFTAASTIVHITLNANGGTLGTTGFYYKVGTNKYYSDSACTKQITKITPPTRTGHTFQHFYGDGTCGGSNGERFIYGASTTNTTVGSFAEDLATDITKNATLYALWSPNTYTISYNANGGSGAPASQTYTYSTSGTTKLSSKTPARNGYTFLGWSQSGSATTASYSAGQSWNLNNAGNYTFYAVWQKNAPKITDVKKFSDGKWYYTVDGEKDLSFSGFASNKNGRWRILNGVVNFQYTNIIKDENQWRYYSGGKWQTNLTSVVKRADGTWWYIKNGVVQSNVTSVVKRADNSTWWYVKNGQVQFGVTSVVKRADNNTWWYVKGGQVQFGVTGLVKRDDNNTWWYVKNGKVQFDANGVVRRADQNSWWYVKDGKLLSSFTGIAKMVDNSSKWFVKNGKVQTTYSGKVKLGGKTYTINNGRVK
ncbi:MAG: InlB B-repeat-containing protein [Lachnospiraceae bacterium]|nr:InlB B-repeat-containing protein [Lachnospiraceae bacterium]